MDIMEQIEDIKLYNRNIRRSHSFLLNVLDLNKYESYFKFILLLSGDINLNPGPTTPKRNDILWELLPFHDCSFSTEGMDYQLDPLSLVSNDTWNTCFKKEACTSLI